MSSELKAIIVESASDVEGNTTTPQGGADGQVDESDHQESADGTSGYSGPKVRIVNEILRGDLTALIQLIG